VQYGRDEVEKYTNNAYNSDFIDRKMTEMHEQTAILLNQAEKERNFEVYKLKEEIKDWEGRIGNLIT